MARSIIERTFGMLKSRWRAIFLRALGIYLFAPKGVAACCILHNLLEDDEEDEEHDEEDEDHGNVPDECSGKNIRARLAAQVSAPGELDACLREHIY